MKHLKNLYSLLLIPILLAMYSVLYAQNDKAQKLQNFIQQNLDASQVIPSVSVVLVNDEEVLFQKAFGYADLPQKRQANDKTDYYIASCTKSFVGLLAHILEKEGKLNLNAQITQYKPFSNFVKKSRFEDITVMDLISHQSGIDNPYLSFRLAYTGEYTDAEILKLVEEETLTNEEGKTFVYTNYGYYLLSLIIKEELGENWQDLLQSKVFAPLGMQQATAYTSKVKDENLALPHIGLFPDKIRIGGLRKNDQMMHAAGGILCNAHDAAKFLQFYLKDGQGIYPEKMLKATYQNKANSEHGFSKVFEGKAYASGWRTGTYRNEQLVYHFGGYSGYFAHISFLPEKKLGIAVFSNSGISSPLANQIADYAYQLYLGEEKNAVKIAKSSTSQLSKGLKRNQRMELTHQQKLAQRTWQLSLPREKYVGKFRNEKLGTAELTWDGNNIKMQVGSLSCLPTAFPSQDCMRVELIPGTGMLICFKVEDGKVIDFSYRREIFSKVEE